MGPGVWTNGKCRSLASSGAMASALGTPMLLRAFPAAPSLHWSTSERPSSSALAVKSRTGLSLSNLPSGCNFLPSVLPNFKPSGRRIVEANAKKSKQKAAAPVEPVVEEQEVEVEISWVEEKAEDAVQYLTSAVKAVPGPRVGGGDLPWLLAVPLGYAAISFVIAVVKTARKLSSPREKRRQQIGKNAWLCETLSDYLPAKREALTPKVFEEIAKQSKFDAEEVMRKYIRYALNERPFNPELVADLIHLKGVTGLDDETVVEVLNEVSRRIVKAKGPVIMKTTGFTEKGLKRKAAVQALFSKILYLAELDQFCSTENRSSLSIKEIFGVTEEDANNIRIESLSGTTELESLEKSVGISPDDEKEEKDEDE
ncbi:hypothetical protein AXG93_2090s1120 [Marchantia polymorpha subsp. ruderalis]|uniref:Armadillo-like repeats domain-containing protein n=1 Tax=Marchantia polymorpha subsp. ruderalis TaxID=1480154 RepID=A0A176WBC9_MARPO|nr:hypothetical protein AXG93_2090s1120 [Marchantia polymorpha subsp. ruderalis]